MPLIGDGGFLEAYSDVVYGGTRLFDDSAYFVLDVCGILFVAVYFVAMI